MGVNVLLTLLIVLRLQIVRSRVKANLGVHHASQYLSITSMLVESAAISTAVSLLFLIPYTMHSYTATVFQGLTGLIQVSVSG